MKTKLWRNRIEIDMVVEIYTESDSEEYAGATAEDIADDLPRLLEEHMNPEEDGYIINWGVRHLDTEPYEEDE